MELTLRQSSKESKVHLLTGPSLCSLATLAEAITLDGQKAAIGQRAEDVTDTRLEAEPHESIGAIPHFRRLVWRLAR